MNETQDLMMSQNVKKYCIGLVLSVLISVLNTYWAHKAWAALAKVVFGLVSNLIDDHWSKFPNHSLLFRLQSQITVSKKKKLTELSCSKKQ